MNICSPRSFLTAFCEMKKVFEEAHPERGRPSWGRIGVHDKGQLHWQGQLPGRGGHISYMLFHNADWTNRKKALRNRRKKPAFQIWSNTVAPEERLLRVPSGASVATPRWHRWRPAQRPAADWGAGVTRGVAMWIRLAPLTNLQGSHYLSKKEKGLVWSICNFMCSSR